MALYDWIIAYIMPLFGSPTAADIENFSALFWFMTSCVICYFTVYLPYTFIKWCGKLPSFFPWRTKK